MNFKEHSGKDGGMGMNYRDGFEAGRKAMIGWVYWAFVTGVALVVAIDIIASLTNKVG